MGGGRGLRWLRDEQLRRARDTRIWDVSRVTGACEFGHRNGAQRCGARAECEGRWRGDGGEGSTQRPLGW